MGPPRTRVSQGHGATRNERPEVSEIRPDDGAGRRREESMAFRELTMIDVKEVLRRWSAAQSDRKIAREGCVDRKTAARYTRVAASLFERGRELTDDEVHEVAQRVQARPVPPPSAEWSEVARHRPLIEH